MFQRLRKNPSFLPSSCSFLVSQVRTLLIRSPVSELSSSSPLPQPHHRNCPRSVAVQVWWDVDNCGVPSGVSLSDVAPSVTAAVRANGIKGPIEIRAFGDFLSSKYSEFDKITLMSNGIRLFPITGVDKYEYAYECLHTDLNYWVLQNPPPAHLFLILGDTDREDFSLLLHWLRMRNYNILVACSGRGSDILRNAATLMWQWYSILKGEDLIIAKHFNHLLPDGPYNSWYGDSKAPLEPWSDIESVSMQVKKILSLYPHGISIGELRQDLTMCALPMDKGFYEDKMFSNFLLSMPDVEIMYVEEEEDEEGGLSLSNQKGSNFILRLKQSTATTNVGSVDAVKISFQSIPSQGKPIGKYVDGRS